MLILVVFKIKGGVGEVPVVSLVLAEEVSLAVVLVVATKGQVPSKTDMFQNQFLLQGLHPTIVRQDETSIFPGVPLGLA